MKKFELSEQGKQERKSMPCGSSEKLIPELKEEGWKYEWSFHTKFLEQWNDACDRVERLQRDGFWKCVLVQGQDETERKDGVAYIYKKKTKRYDQYEKDMGYK